LHNRSGKNSQVKYVALKIHAARVDVTNELSIQQHLTASSPKDVNSNFVLLLTDSFILEGPNGKHSCFVTEPTGPSVADVLNAPHDFYDPLDPPTNRFSTPRNKRVLTQVLSGLKFLHDNDIVHGDLQPGNLLFSLRDIARLGPDELQQNESTAQLDHLIRTDGKADRWSPRYLIVPEPFIEGDLQDQEVVKLADFGGGMLTY
jgi:non-specific serine/threonine protein kinase